MKIGDQTTPIELKATLKSNQRQWQELLEYLRQYGGDLGVALSLAPLSETRLANGARVLNLRTYLAENLKNCRGAFALSDYGP